MNMRKYMMGTVTPLAIIAASCSAAWADTLDSDPLISISGDGSLFADPDEGVLEPGLKAVTFTSTRVGSGDSATYVDPFENIITDFSTLSSRGDVPNCLMASNPDIYCDSASGSGKRIKAWLTGRNPFDIRLRTTASPATPSVDYFTFGKVSNFTGARLTGFELQLLDADGNSMGALTPANAALFNLNATAIGLGSGLPDGLFGEGGNEGEIGFFSDEKARLALTSSTDVLAFGELTNTAYVENFGSYFLDDSMVPDGLFWDDNTDPDDESALVAWNNIADGGWTYGTLDTAANIAARLQELATTLGVEVADLNYVEGGLLPADIVAAATANGLFAIDPIEDLRNANLNYTTTIGTIDGGEMILRMVPQFAPIVTSATTDYQFSTAGYLDAAANVPYLDVGNAAAYQTAITELLAMDAADRSLALDSTGFGYAAAFSSVASEAARGQVSAVTSFAPLAVSTDGPAAVSTRGTGNIWSMTDGMYGLASIGGSSSNFDATSTSLGYDVDITSFTVGVEKLIDGSNSSLGLALGYINGSASADNGLGDVDADGYTLTAFSRTRFGQGGLVQALIGYQDLSYDSSRYVMGQTATGTADGSQVFAAVKVDYMKDRGAFKFGPTASLEYYDSSVDGFTETGAGIWNRTVGGLSSDTFLASIGVRGEYAFHSGGNENRVVGSVKYTKASGDDLVVQSGFVGLPGAASTVAGLDEDLIDVAFGFDSVLSSTSSNQVVLQAGYRGSFGKDYDSQGVHIGIKMAF